MKTVVTISKKWNNPQINILIDVEGIELKMDLSDFREALKREIGSITWTFKKETFDSQLDAAITRVISGIKEESAKVI